MPSPAQAAVYLLLAVATCGLVLWFRPHLDRGGIDIDAKYIAVVVAVIALLLLRRFLLALQAARVGSVEIVHPKSQSVIPTDEIVADLRQALKEVYLSSPSVVPGESTPQDFLTDVRTAASNPAGWGLIAAVLGALLRRSAYRVTLVPRVHGTSKQLGLTIEIVSRLSGDMAITTIWDQTWPAVARRAAFHVAAFVLPRTNLSRKSPWVAWRGVELNPDLFFSFHEARRLARAGRLEEALTHFDNALDYDPLNSYIRVEKATVLDQLGLYVDALAMYVDVVTIESAYDRRLWKRYRKIVGDNNDGKPKRWILWRIPNGPAALQLARYRMVGSLAASGRIAEQWARHRKDSVSATQTRRQAEATRVINRLRPLLHSYDRLMRESHNASPPDRTARGKLETSQARLRRVLQFAALLETRALEEDYRILRGRRWLGSLPISQQAIRLMPIWAAIQYRYVEHVETVSRRNGIAPQRKEDAFEPLRDRHMRSVHRRLQPGHESLDPDATHWQPSATGVRQLVHRALHQRLPFVHRGWHEHYNAACVYAVTMLTPDLYKHATTPLPVAVAENHQRLVQLAVQQLTQAVVASDSQFTAGVAPWLRRGDQDLDDLRVTENYQTFVDRYLPQTAALPHTPPNVALLIMSGHLIHLVEQFARLCRDHWARATGNVFAVAPLDPVALRDEALRWRRVHEFSRNYRDWQTRHELILSANHLVEAADGASQPAIDSTFLSLEEDKRWVQLAKSIGSPPPLVKQDREEREVERVVGWLSVSENLGTHSMKIKDLRNDALDELARTLSLYKERIDHAADPIPRGSGTWPDAAQFAEAWGAVEAWMLSLRTGGEPHPEREREALKTIKSLWVPVD